MLHWQETLVTTWHRRFLQHLSLFERFVAKQRKIFLRSICHRKVTVRKIFSCGEKDFKVMRAKNKVLTLGLQMKYKKNWNKSPESWMEVTWHTSSVHPVVPWKYYLIFSFSAINLPQSPRNMSIQTVTSMFSPYFCFTYVATRVTQTSPRGLLLLITTHWWMYSVLIVDSKYTTYWRHIHIICKLLLRIIMHCGLCNLFDKTVCFSNVQQFRP